MELEGLDRLARGALGPLQARQDPAVLHDRGRPPARRLDVGADAQQHEARRVEQLVGQLLALLDLLGAVAHVLGGGHRQQAEARGVGAVGVDHLDRVDAGAQRLAHPPPVGGLDDRVDVDLLEGDLLAELQAHHDHAGDPQEDDVARRRVDLRRVEGAQLGRVLRPAERGERPQRRAEPRVEHVGVALPAVALGRRQAAVDLLVGSVLAPVPDGDLVAPPQLARDAPRADLLHPLQVDAGPALGHEPHRPSRTTSIAGSASGSMRMNHCSEISGSTRAPERWLNGHLVRCRPRARAPAPRPRAGRRSARAPPHRQAGERLPRLGVHAAVLADDGELLQAVLAADLEVVGVVARRDLQRAGAEVGLHVGVADDRQPAADDRQDRRAPDQVAVALVLRVHRDGGVGQHRLRAHRGHDDLAAALQRVGDRVQRVGDLALLDLEVADRRAQARVPVDHAVVAVDQALVVERDEHAQDGLGVALVQREALVLVVAATRPAA